MAEPAWQELLRLRLAERNAKDSAFAPVIEQCTCMPFVRFTTFIPFIFIDYLVRYPKIVGWRSKQNF
jgi:hypothetical protein